MFDRHQAGQRVVLVQPYEKGTSSEDHVAEFHELATSAGLSVEVVITAPLDVPKAKYYVGTGKVEEIHTAADAHDADVILFNCTLAPVQERNIERAVKRRVFDRNTLILDIFAQRARTHEGKLQVELAQLRHLSTRLVRGWTHLERQKGGIGLRGPGETQLETDRRLLAERMRGLKSRLEKVDKQREQGRRRRTRSNVPVVSLVGYTNAGKSTLFNALTQSDIYAADQLFATLDPTMRRLEGLDCGPVVLGDTVGFIRDLPHELVAAFKSTLSETREADLLLLVVDAADPERQEKVDAVKAVLAEIGAETVPVLEVMNKIDLTKVPAGIRGDGEAGQRVYVSAHTGAGLDDLKVAIAKKFADRMQPYQVAVPTDAPILRARLFEWGDVQDEWFADNAWQMRVVLSPLAIQKVRKMRGNDGKAAKRLFKHPIAPNSSLQ